MLLFVRTAAGSHLRFLGGSKYVTGVFGQIYRLQVKFFVDSVASSTQLLCTQQLNMGEQWQVSLLAILDLSGWFCWCCDAVDAGQQIKGDGSDAFLMLTRMKIECFIILVIFIFIFICIISVINHPSSIIHHPSSSSSSIIGLSVLSSLSSCSCWFLWSFLIIKCFTQAKATQNLDKKSAGAILRGKKYIQQNATVDGRNPAPPGMYKTL